MRGFLLVAATTMAAFLTVTPANADEAGLKVCNDSEREVRVALGRQAEHGWQSEGWTTIGVGDCGPVIPERLVKRHYYLYATDGDGGAWQGDVLLCARGRPFTIFGTSDCLVRGYVPTPFFEVETRGAPGWTVYLTARGAAAIEAAAAITAWEQALPAEAAPYQLYEVVTSSVLPASLEQLLAESGITASDSEAVLPTIAALGAREASELRIWYRPPEAVAERMTFRNGGEHVVTIVRTGLNRFVRGVDPGR